MLGGWASWMLGSGGGLRRPWLWALSFFLSGGDGVTPAEGYRWKRLFLGLYWVGVLVVAVGGWQTKFVRARRIRMKNAGGPGCATTSSVSKPGKAGPKVAAELAREEKSFHASLNMRRKFFHALAVALFAPGIAVDVSPPGHSQKSARKQLIRSDHTARLHLPRFLSRLFTLHVLRVRAVLRPLPRRRPAPHLLHRVRRLERQWTRHSQPLLPPHRVRWRPVARGPRCEPIHRSPRFGCRRRHGVFLLIDATH